METGWAQSTDSSVSAGPSRRIVRKVQPIDSVEPVEVGSFLVYPEMSLTGLYDDNVYFSATGKQGDWAAIASPGVFAQSAWDKHAATLSAYADLTRYHSFETESTDDFRVSAEGRYDFSTSANLYGGVRAARDHEDRESPDSRNGLSPTQYKNSRAYAGVYRQFGKVGIRIGGTAQRLDYRDVEFTLGRINMDDRDRSQYTGGIRVILEVSPSFEPFVQVAADSRRYSNDPDDLGYLRDSQGERYIAGARVLKAGRVKAEVFGGYATQRYEDRRFADVRVPTAGANVLIQATPDTSVSIFMDRTVEETTLSGVSGNVNSYASMGMLSRISSSASIHADVAFSRNAYQIQDRTDDYTSAGAGVYFYPARGVTLDASYQYRNLDSSVSGESFQKHQIFFRCIFAIQPPGTKR